MNNDRESNLDKWLQKNINHSSDAPPRPQGFFSKFKKSPAPQVEQKSETPQVNPFQKPKNHRPHRFKKKPLQPKEKLAKPSEFAPKTNLKDKIKTRPDPNSKLKIIPLGGLNEVGKNMLAVEYGNDLIVVDMGMQFPEEDMLGVDYIVPDFTYIKENAQKLRGILITHAHLDHIGGIPYISKQLQNPTFYGLRLTMGMIEKNIAEFGLKNSTKLITVNPREKFTLGCFKVTFFRVNHSIPDSTGVIIETPVGIIVHTGDFKFDFTPADGIPADMETLKWLGTQNVLALLSDSTNSTKPGHTISEKVVGETLDKIIRETPNRLIIASFSSLIGRMQQIFNSAAKHNKKIFVSGRSMVDNIEIATRLGYLKYPKDLVRPLNRAKKDAIKPNSIILTTGSQGEEMSALTRMALNEHKHIKINSKDTVVYSSNPIVGNERSIYAVVNELTRKGAKVISNKILDVHTTGHGNQEDLRLMINLVKPKYLIPVHGEFYMRSAHKDLAVQCGIKSENIILADNGSVIEGITGKLFLSEKTVSANYILVDNQSGDLSGIASHILSERQAMAYNGIIIATIKTTDQKFIKDINIESHGFIYLTETTKILNEIKLQIKLGYESILEKNKKLPDTELIKAQLRSIANKTITNKLERRPLIIISIV